MVTPEQLAQLHDLALPDPIGWWPMAFAWWILLLSIFALLFGIIWHSIDVRRKRAYRRQAREQVGIIMRSDISAEQKIEQLNQLLKRVAITAYGRRNVAHLSDQQWLEFLHTKAQFIEQNPKLLEIYRLSFAPANSLEDYDQALHIWQQYTLQWIKGHHQ